MTTLSPTPSSRGPLRGAPIWLIVVIAALIGILLIGAGLLLTRGSDDKTAATPTPTCTPTKPAGKATKPPTKKVSINVYNSTDRIGLAADTATALETRDFDIGKVTNDPAKAQITGTAVVRYVPGSLTAARWAAAQVPEATLQKVVAKGHAGADVDVVLGTGYDKLATTAAATAAFASSVPSAAC